MTLAKDDTCFVALFAGPSGDVQGVGEPSKCTLRNTLGLPQRKFRHQFLFTNKELIMTGCKGNSFNCQEIVSQCCLDFASENIEILRKQN